MLTPFAGPDRPALAPNTAPRVSPRRVVPVTCEWQSSRMALFDPLTTDRLKRVLRFLSVSGGAALISKPERRVLAASGEIEDAAALAALDVSIDPIEAIVSVAPDGLIADIGRRHRLFVRVPGGLPDPAFADRLRRARDLIERFALHVGGRNPPAAPPGSAPAHAVVFAPSRPRRS